MRLLVADDDREVLDLVHYTFMPDGFTILAAEDGDKALKLVATQSPDLVLIDHGLPGEAGVALLGELRRRTNVPIIMLTTAHDDDQLVNALQLGADDCLAKPLRPRVLRARVHALLRLFQSANATFDAKRPIELGGIVLEPRTRRVTVDGQTVHLSRTEFALLECLMRNHGNVVRLPQLVSNVWGYEGNDNENVVKVAISRLRRKIESDPGVPRYIVNVPGVGYMFHEQAAASEPVYEQAGSQLTV